MNDIFRRFANAIANAIGSPWTFTGAIALILLWFFCGIVLNFSDTWLMIANTGITLITFLLVILVQSTQNRETRAIHLKLDELIKGVDGSRTSLMGLEELSDDKLEQVKEEHKQVVRSAAATDK